VSAACPRPVDTLMRSLDCPGEDKSKLSATENWARLSYSRHSRPLDHYPEIEVRRVTSFCSEYEGVLVMIDPHEAFQDCGPGWGRMGTLRDTYYIFATSRRPQRRPRETWPLGHAARATGARRSPISP